MTRLALALGPALAFGLTVAFGLAPGSLAAQDVSGALSGHVVIADGDLGGGTMVDVWARFDWLRVGGFLGVSSVSSPRDSRNRIAMPIGASVAFVFDLGLAEIQLRLRGGLWGGATQGVKLTAGGFLGGGPYVMFDLGGGASFGGGLEVWGILGEGETWAVTPGLSLSWGATSPPSEDSEADGEAVP